MTDRISREEGDVSEATSDRRNVSKTLKRIQRRGWVIVYGYRESYVCSATGVPGSGCSLDMDDVRQMIADGVIYRVGGGWATLYRLKEVV